MFAATVMQQSEEGEDIGICISPLREIPRIAADPRPMRGAMDAIPVQGEVLAEKGCQPGMVNQV